MRSILCLRRRGAGWISISPGVRRISCRRSGMILPAFLLKYKSLKNVRNFQKIARLYCFSVVDVCVAKTERGTHMAKKRANGEGNIRKRKDGRWEGRYTAGIDPETGKLIAKSVLARTQRECKEKLQKTMEELEKIDVTKRRDYTVGEWAQLWYENYAKPSVRASTAAYYKTTSTNILCRASGTSSWRRSRRCKSRNSTMKRKRTAECSGTKTWTI